MLCSFAEPGKRFPTITFDNSDGKLLRCEQIRRICYCTDAALAPGLDYPKKQKYQKKVNL